MIELLILFELNKNVLTIDDLKTRLFGSKMYVDLEVGVDANLSLRTIACLKRINVITVKDLLNVRFIDLLKAKNLGKKSFQEISNFIKDNICLLD